MMCSITSRISDLIAEEKTAEPWRHWRVETSVDALIPALGENK
jgi:hypothetical protein